VIPLETPNEYHFMRLLSVQRRETTRNRKAKRTLLKAFRDGVISGVLSGTFCFIIRKFGQRKVVV